MLILFAIFNLVGLVQAGSTIILDSGHIPSKGPEGGATAVCGQKEYVYNDEVVEQVAHVLKNDIVLLTRKMNEPIRIDDHLIAFLPEAEKVKWKFNPSLYERAAFANQQKADFFLSIHHDSVSERHLKKNEKICDGKGGMEITPDFKASHNLGFNIFLNPKAPKAVYEKSLRFATSLARAMIKLGRTPSNYHRYPDDDCRSCAPIDEKLGIWSQDLAVLRSIQMPGALLEVGVIVDSEDEKKVTLKSFREKLAEAISKSLHLILAK